MPPPEMLGEYERHVPGSGDRMLRMAEATTTERARTDDKLADAEIEQARNSTSLAALLVVLAFIGAAVFFALGNNVAGCAFLSLPVAMMVRTVVDGIRGRSEQ